MIKHCKILTSLTLLAALSAAGSAAAGGVAVKVAGRDDATVQADIARAARTVCKRAYMDQALGPYLQRGCVRRTAAEALAQVEQAKAASAGASRLASAK